jgi:hypothetical protein
MLEKRAKVIWLAKAWGGERIAPPALRRPIGIEELLRWAYLEELPKEGAERSSQLPQGYVPGWMKVGKFLENMASVDNAVVNRYGLLPDAAAMCGPHPDAVIVAEAVMALDDAS